MLVVSASSLNFCLGPASLSVAGREFQVGPGFSEVVMEANWLGLLDLETYGQISWLKQSPYCQSWWPVWIIQGRPEGTSVDLSTCFRMENDYHSTATWRTNTTLLPPLAVVFPPLVFYDGWIKDGNTLALLVLYVCLGSKKCCLNFSVCAGVAWWEEHPLWTWQNWVWILLLPKYVTVSELFKPSELNFPHL